MSIEIKDGWMKKVMNSFFPPILIALTFFIGAISLYMTPKEEDPQIVVPMIDVLVQAPGLSAQQVANQVTQPVEKLVSQIDGVEYVYSMSDEGMAQIIVRFYVGEEREDSIVKLYNKLYSNQDQIPASVTQWQVMPVEIDDVPIVVASLYSTDPDNLSQFELKRVAEQATQRLKALSSTNEVKVIGGQSRAIEVVFDSKAMASRQTTISDIQRALDLTHSKARIGDLTQQGRRYIIESGDFLSTASDLEKLVVNVINGKPVYLQDVANIKDGAIEATTDTWYHRQGESEPLPAVFISVAKQNGANAVSVAEAVLQELESLSTTQFPSDVGYSIIRNYGETASDKVTNLVSSLGVSILTVVVFIGVFLNWRSAIVVGIAIPISYGAAIGLDLAFGYSINRVTLFALILALGLIVDDPIASIDNIERYLERKDLPRSKAIIMAMSEIKSALLMSTVAIVIVFTPMFFITGMMGPYMAPLAFNVPISVIFSTLVAFLITPWLAKKILKRASDHGAYSIESTLLYKVYRKTVEPLLKSRRKSWAFLGAVLVLFIGAAILPAMRVVPLKLLPYDNKDEFQLVLNMQETANHVDTSNALRAFSEYLVEQPYIDSVSGFAGVASPMDFNGMVRHYFMRSEPYHGELRIVLKPKSQRELQSHEFVTYLRPDIEAIARQFNADIQLVEVPPGPPVISAIAAEVYGGNRDSYSDVQEQAKRVASRLEKERFVSEVDTSIQGDITTLQFKVDSVKAAQSGVSVADINQTLMAANQGLTIGTLRDDRELSPLPVVIQLDKSSRDAKQQLLSLYVRGQAGMTKTEVNGATQDAPQALVQLSELGEFVERRTDQPIYHKNLHPVVYVYAETIGRVPAEIVADVYADQVTMNELEDTSHHERSLSSRSYLNNGAGIPWAVTDSTNVVWGGEGEWQITIAVFRDLGIAYGAALLGVFFIMLIQTGLPAVSGIIMLAIPLTVIGIMPGFWILNTMSGDINGYPNPALFTATAMIGMIALAGIVVRNSLVLIEFIQQSLKQGMPLNDALIQSGAVRMRPILLTAGTTLLGNIVITLDPIFNGLAWAIIFGITASTIFTLLVIPVVYNLAYRNVKGHGLKLNEEEL
jgi:multidrug efflux pump subunit AcrB